MALNDAGLNNSNILDGPDRRYKSREKSAIPLIDVPNSLREKATGTYNAKQFRSQINGAIGNINGQKMERHAVTLALHAEILVDQFETGRHNVDDNRLEQLQVAVTDLRWRARRGITSHHRTMRRAAKRDDQDFRRRG